MGGVFVGDEIAADLNKRLPNRGGFNLLYVLKIRPYSSH